MKKKNLTSFYIFGYLLELRKKFRNLKKKRLSKKIQ